MEVLEALGQEAVDHLSVALVQRASLLTRLIFRHARPGVSRSEGSLLSTLSDGPYRISTLAELEGLAQPTVTLLVQRLEQQGLVSRGRTAADGRVVLVSLTDAGQRRLDELRKSYQGLLRVRMSELTEAQIDALEAADRGLAILVDMLQEGLPG